MSTALKDVSERLSAHVEVAEKLITPLLERHAPEFAEISAGEIVRAAIAQTRELARSVNAKVRSKTTAISVLVPADLVVQALAGIVSNAIEAPRSDGTRAEVEVSATRRNGDVAIAVSDNGTGIPGATTDTALSSIKSTKGRPAVGLYTAERSLLVARGRLTMLATGTEGTTFELLLPTRVAGLRGRSQVG